MAKPVIMFTGGKMDDDGLTPQVRQFSSLENCLEFLSNIFGRWNYKSNIGDTDDTRDIEGLFKTPHPILDRILIYEIAPPTVVSTGPVTMSSATLKLVWHYSGARFIQDASDVGGPLAQGKLPNDYKTLRNMANDSLPARRPGR